MTPNTPADVASLPAKWRATAKIDALQANPIAPHHLVNRMRACADELEAALTPTGEGGTPSSRWSANGEPDPHGTRYDCERAALAMGDMSDDELANAVFLHGNERPSMADLSSGKALLPIAYLTAAKDRIRWLSRRLATTEQPGSSVQGELLAAAVDYFGPLDDPSLGWCDPKASDPKLFRCEKCGAEHLDSALISHISGCRAVRLRDALIAAASEVTTMPHSTQDNYDHFLAYSGLDHTPLLQYAYFHGADVGMDKPTGTAGIPQRDQDFAHGYNARMEDEQRTTPPPAPAADFCKDEGHVVVGDTCFNCSAQPAATQPEARGVEGICKGTNCSASKANGHRHSSECLFDHARAVASGVESFALGVTLNDDISYVNWRGQRIDLAAASAAAQASVAGVFSQMSIGGDPVFPTTEKSP